MSKVTIIRQSPLVLIKRIIEVDIAASVILFFISFITNFEQIFRATVGGFFSRYDIFIFVIASFLQLIITLIVFFIWQSEEFRLKEKEISFRRSFFFSKEKSILLKNVTLVEYKRSLLEMMLNYGTIVLHTGENTKPFHIRNVETAEIYSNIIKDAVDRALLRKVESPKRHSILDLIIEGESSRLELKQTFRWDTKQKITSKSIEHSVMKTIAAFLNSGGGNLIIGVTDNGKIYGLEDDYQSLVRKDRDGFENHFNQVVKHTIGAQMRQNINLIFEKIEDKDVCLIEVESSLTPVFLTNNENEEFFIRTGNTTSPLKISEVNSYIDSHWGK